MSALPLRPADTEMVVFSDYLTNRGLKNDPPVSIKAADLDQNFARGTVIEPPPVGDRPPAYKVSYTSEGTVLSDFRGLPEGAMFKQFDVCENGSPVQYWFVVWEEQPELP